MKWRGMLKRQWQRAEATWQAKKQWQGVLATSRLGSVSVQRKTWLPSFISSVQTAYSCASVLIVHKIGMVILVFHSVKYFEIFR